MLEMEPNEILRFTGPFTRPTNTTLSLTNSSDSPILFKIKTTAPKLYCVRPNRGALRPLETKLIDICLQSYEKDKHKFLVLSVLQPDGEFSTFQEMWDRASSLAEPQKAKLKCIFVMPDEACIQPAPNMESTDTLHDGANLPSVSHHVKAMPSAVNTRAMSGASSSKAHSEAMREKGEATNPEGRSSMIELTSLERNLTLYEAAMAAEDAKMARFADPPSSSRDAATHDADKPPKPISAPQVEFLRANNALDGVSTSRTAANAKRDEPNLRVTKFEDPPTISRSRMDTTRPKTVGSAITPHSSPSAPSQAYDTASDIILYGLDSAELLTLQTSSNKFEGLNNKIVSLRLENEYLKRENEMLQDQIGKLNTIRKAGSLEFNVPVTRIEFHTFNLLIAVVSGVLGYLMAKYSM